MDLLNYGFIYEGALPWAINPLNKKRNKINLGIGKGEYTCLKIDKT